MNDAVGILPYSDFSDVRWYLKTEYKIGEGSLGPSNPIPRYAYVHTASEVDMLSCKTNNVNYENRSTNQRQIKNPSLKNDNTRAIENQQSSILR